MLQFMVLFMMLTQQWIWCLILAKLNLACCALESVSRQRLSTRTVELNYGYTQPRFLFSSNCIHCRHRVGRCAVSVRRHCMQQSDIQHTDSSSTKTATDVRLVTRCSDWETLCSGNVQITKVNALHISHRCKTCNTLLQLGNSVLRKCPDNKGKCTAYDISHSGKTCNTLLLLGNSVLRKCPGNKGKWTAYKSLYSIFPLQQTRKCCSINCLPIFSHCQMDK